MGKDRATRNQVGKKFLRGFCTRRALDLFFAWVALFRPLICRLVCFSVFAIGFIGAFTIAFCALFALVIAVNQVL